MEDLNLYLVIYSLAISTAIIYILFTWVHKEEPFTVSGVLCFPTYSGALDISYWITSCQPDTWPQTVGARSQDLLSGENLGKQWDATQTLGIPRNDLEERSYKVAVVWFFS